MKIKSFLAIGLSCIVLSAQASIVEIGNYQRINGLDWLDLSVTDEMSYSEVQNGFSGWTLATHDQYTAMFSEFETVGDDRISNISSSSIDNNSAGFEEIITNYTIGLGNQIYDDFGRIFGYTFEDSEFGYRSLGYYADGNNQAVGGLEIYNTRDSRGNSFATVRSFYDYSTYASTDGSFDGNRHAWFLVRPTNFGNGLPPINSVPEPSIIALMGFGVLGLTIMRRRKIS